MSETKKQGIEIQLDEQVSQGNYCNLAIIAHSPSEFILDFATILPGINKALYDRIEVTDFRKKSWLDPEYTWNPSSETYNPNNGYQFAGNDGRYFPGRVYFSFNVNSLNNND